jgi:hypothetical protein
MTTLQYDFDAQDFPNGYQLVNGVTMHAENGNRFQIPPDVLKKHLRIGQFVEVRIDSPRFSVHENAPEKCTCSICEGEASKPIISHEQPATLLSVPKQNVPSRGWGEGFWVRVTERDGKFFKGVVDNPLYEARLHGLYQGDSMYFHEDHILAIHDIHRQELVLGMDAADLKTLAQWLGTLR